MTTLACSVAVDLDTADGTLHVENTTPGAITPGEAFLTDPLSVSWALPVDKPGQPDPLEARFSLVVPGAVPVDVGRRVSVTVLDDTGTNEVVGFHGRVTDVQAAPIDYELADGTPQSGTVVDVVAVDFTVDLAEAPCTTGALPAQSPVSRLRAYEAAISPADMPTDSGGGAWATGYVPTIGGTVYGLDGWVRLRAEDAATGKALERMLGVFDQAGLGILPGGPSDGEPSPTALDRRLAIRAVLAPRVNATTLPANYAHSAGGQGDWYHVDEVTPFYDSDDPSDFPAVLTDTPDGWGLVIDDSSPLVVSAGYVDWGAKFTRNKFTHPNRAFVTYTPDGSTDETTLTVDADDRSSGDPVAPVALSAPLLGALLPTYSQTPEFGPRRMAYMYLPESDARDRWQADAFRYYLPDWSRLIAGSWFPRHHDVDLVSPGTTPGDPATRAACYTRPIVVDGIDPNHNPTGRSWYAGELSAVTLTLADQSATVDFTLRRVLPVPTGDGALTPGDLDPSILVGDLDPAFSVYDYRLARGA